MYAARAEINIQKVFMLKRICVALFIMFPFSLYYAFDTKTQVATLTAGSIFVIAVIFSIIWAFESLFKRVMSKAKKKTEK